MYYNSPPSVLEILYIFKCSLSVMIYMMNSFWRDGITIYKTYQLFLSDRKTSQRRPHWIWKGDVYVVVSRVICMCTCVYILAQTVFVYIHTYLITILESYQNVLLQRRVLLWLNFLLFCHLVIKNIGDDWMAI